MIRRYQQNQLASQKIIKMWNYGIQNYLGATLFKELTFCQFFWRRLVPRGHAYKLLDVGGGLGQTDLALLACNKLEIDMTIFELEPIVNIGKQLQKNKKT